MTIDDIKVLIASDESRTLELKKTTGELKDGMHIKEPHDSYPYNVKMAEVLYRSMWLENWGSGAKRIIEACQEQGVEEPTWRWDGAFVYVTFKRPIKQSTVSLDTVSDSGDSTQEMGGSTQETGSRTQEIESSTQEMGNSTQETLTTNRERVLSMLRENPTLTLSEVAESIGLTRDGVKKITDKLRHEGILSRKGSTKAGQWVVVNTSLKN